MKHILKKKLKSSSKRWLTRQFKDVYVIKAKEEGFRSRSAFKLSEINKKFRILGNNLNILELGSSPGGWAQFYSKINTKGKNLAIDLINMMKVENVNFLKNDFLSESCINEIHNFFENKKIDIILSDMAPNTIGNSAIDSIKVNRLALEVVNFGYKLLNFGGYLITKYFSGKDELSLIKVSKYYFKKINFFKPASSRSESKEMYLVLSGLRKN